MTRRPTVSARLAGLWIAAMLTAVGTIAAAPPEEGAPKGTATVAVQRVPLADPGLREEAAMVLVGTALIGLAAAVRRAA
jgi:hypothetical protein